MRSLSIRPVGERQALYNGELVTRTMHNLWRYGNAAIYNNNAYTITSLYHCGYLQLCTVRPSKPARPGRDTDYQMTLLRSYSLKDMWETFRKGVPAFRNAWVWTKEQRDSLILDGIKGLSAPSAPRSIREWSQMHYRSSCQSSTRLELDVVVGYLKFHGPPLPEFLSQ